MSLFDNFSKLFREFSSKKAQLEKEIESGKQQREHLQCAPMSREDFVERFNIFVDAKQDQYTRQLTFSVENLQRRPLQDPSGLPPGKPIHTVVANIFGDRIVSQDLIIGLFGDLIKERYAKALEKVEWQADCGPPLADREQQISKCDKSIAKLEKELTELLDAVDKSGGNSARL